MSEGDYKVFGLSGENNLFYVNYCPDDRLWRRQLLLLNDKYKKTVGEPYDECKNAFSKPRVPQTIDILDNLHSRSDYE